MRVPFRWLLFVALLVALCCPALAASSASAASLPLTFKEVARTSLTAGSTYADDYDLYGFVGDHALVKKEGTDTWGLMDSSGEVPDGFAYVFDALPEGIPGTQVRYAESAGLYVVKEEWDGTTTHKGGETFTLLNRDGKTVGTYQDINIYCLYSNNTVIQSDAFLGDFREYCPEFKISSCGLIGVQDPTTGKWGYVDTSGKQVIDFAYDSVAMFSNGYAVVGTKDADEALKYEYGLIDMSGDVVVAPGTYARLGDCSEDGMVAFEDATSKKAGYLKVADGKATVAVQPTYDSMEMFHEGLALVLTSDQSSSGEWSVIDTSGAVRFSFTGSPDGCYFSDGYLAVNDYKRSDGTTGNVYLDESGSVVIDKGFYKVEGFYGDYAAVQMASENGWGFVDKSGNLHGGTYAYGSVTKTGLAWVKGTNGKYGVIDKTGREVIPCSYEGVWIWDNGIVRMTNADYTYDLFDSAGNKLTTTSYQLIFEPVDSDYYLFERDGKWGVGVLAEPVAPSAPQGLSAAPGDGSLSLSWSAPASDGGSAITGYSVYVGGAKVADLGADATSYVATGLSNGTSYDVSVTARSAAGEGEAATAAATPAAPAYERVWGQGALDTMESIVDEGFTATGGTVVLATGDGYWDALAASGVAGLEGAPVLLTSLDGTTLSPQTEAELGRLAPSRVYVCGGEMAVPDSVMSAVRSVTGVEPQRLWSQDATGTAVSIYEAGEGRWSKTAIVATCQSFMDALSVAPYAYHSGSPIFLARMSDDRLSDETLAAIRDGGFDRVLVVGGAMAVSPDVEGQLASAGVSDVRRLWGQDCEDTSLAIARWEVAEGGMGVSRMGVATDGVEEFVRSGRGYWDSLCGAALCGRDASVLVIAREGRYAAVDGVLSEHASEVVTLRVFGGEAAVPASVLEHALSYLE